MLQLLLKLDLLFREVRDRPIGRDSKEPGSPDTVVDDPIKSLLLLPAIDSPLPPIFSSFDFSLDDNTLYDHLESELRLRFNLVAEPSSMKSRYTTL